MWDIPDLKTLPNWGRPCIGLRSHCPVGEGSVLPGRRVHMAMCKPTACKDLEIQVTGRSPPTAQVKTQTLPVLREFAQGHISAPLCISGGHLQGSG